MRIIDAIVVTPSSLPGLMCTWENHSKKEHAIREGLDLHLGNFGAEKNGEGIQLICNLSHFYKKKKKDVKMEPDDGFVSLLILFL